MAVVVTPRVTRPRVAIVVGGVFPEQLALWSACQELDASVTVIGTKRNVHRGVFPWNPKKPTDVPARFARLLTPPGLDRRGQNWWLYGGLGKILAHIRPNVVHVVSEPWGGLAVQALAVRRRLDQPPRVCIHGTDNIYWHGPRLEQSIRRALIRQVFPRVDGFASWSREGVEVAREAGLGHIPTVVIPAILPDPDQFTPASVRTKMNLRRKLGLPLQEEVLGFIGRLVPEKGVRDLIDALRVMGDRAPFLAVWGNGPLANAVDGWCRTGAVRGRLLGPLPLAGAPDAYRACDAVAVPSRTTASWKEQFGRVLIEAMFSERAVVAYRSGAIPEVVGDAGLLVNEGDVNGLAQAISDLMTDTETRESLAQMGRNRALELYHPRALAEQMVGFWTEVLGSTGC
jgi:glycosyltransferase involved in cell wall biosynthesis